MLLSFDNKSKFQVVLDMPEGTSLEQTTKVLDAMRDYLGTVPEVTDYQVHSGTASPIGSNGLVRQYYLREDAHLGDIQVNLVKSSTGAARATRSPWRCASPCRPSPGSSTAMPRSSRCRPVCQ